MVFFAPKRVGSQGESIEISPGRKASIITMEDHSSEEVIPSRSLPLSLPMTPDCAHPFELVPHPNNGLEDRGIRRFRNTTVAARAKLQFHQYTYAVVPDITTAIVPANTPFFPFIQSWHEETSNSNI